MALVGLPLLALLVIVGTSGILILANSGATQTVRQPPATPTPTTNSPSATPTSHSLPPGNDWPVYRGNVYGTGVNTESVITTANVAQLKQAWYHGAGVAFMAASAIVNGVLYITHGNALLAYEVRTGTQLWRYDGIPQSHGLVSSSVAVDAASHMAFYGSPDTRVYGVDIRSGQMVWNTLIGNADQGAHIWSSPLVANGKVYIGLASNDDHPCVRGAVFALDEITGHIVWTHYTVPAGSLGGSVWASVAANPSLRELLVTTGNPCPAGPTIAEDDSFVALDWDTGRTLWHYTAIGYDNCDCDFGQGPADFTYQGQEYVVGGNKFGYVYTLKPPAAAGGQPQLVWKTQIAVPGYYQQGGIYQPPTYANGLVFIGGGPTPDNSCSQGALWAFHVDTGELAWHVCTTDQPISPAAFSGGVLFNAEADKVLAFDAATGNVLWHASYHGLVWGGLAVSRGFLVLPTVSNGLFCFTLPGLAP